MKRNRAAIRYAKAILEFAQEQKEDKQVKEDFDALLVVFSENPALVAFIESPVQENKQKLAVVEKIPIQMSGATKKALNLLAQNQRIELLEAVALEYQLRYDDQQGVKKAVVTTAAPLDKSLEKEVLAIAKKMTSHKVVLENNIKPELIGGFILQLGDQQYDASVAHQLQRIRQELTVH